MARLVEKMELTPTQMHATCWLGLDGPLTMGELARRLGITVKTVTGIVDRLEQRKLAKRCRRAADRRVVEVSATKKGKELWLEFDAHARSRTALFLSALPKEDQDALVRIFEGFVGRVVEAEGNS